MAWYALDSKPARLGTRDLMVEFAAPISCGFDGQKSPISVHFLVGLRIESFLGPTVAFYIALSLERGNVAGIISEPILQEQGLRYPGMCCTRSIDSDLWICGLTSTLGEIESDTMLRVPYYL